jgi:hypothetical protein
MESELVAPQHGDVDIAVWARFGVEEEIKRPPACNPPRCLEIREELSHIVGPQAFPLIRRFGHRLSRPHTGPSSPRYATPDRR